MKNITLDEIEANTGGVVTDLQPEDKIYMEKVSSGNPNARVTNVESIVSKTMESVEELIQPLIDADKEIIYTWDLSSKGQFIDCSTIDASYNTLKITGISPSPASHIFNIADSGIRYIVKESNNIRSIGSSFDYITCEITTLYFFPYNDDAGTEIFKCETPKESGITITDNSTMYLTKQRGYVFFIRFNEDLTQTTEYFNTDEFLIPFSYDGTTLVHDTKTCLNTWQPTTGAEYQNLITSYKYFDGTIDAGGAKTPIKENYLLNYPIHSPCLTIVIEKGETYLLNTSSLRGLGVFYFKHTNDVEYYKYIILPEAYNSMNRFIYEAIITPAFLKKIINNFKVLSMSVEISTDHDIYVSVVEGSTVLSATKDTGLYNSPDRTIKTEELGFYANVSTLHALTNVSFFDKYDNPIPTGYDPVKK